MGEREQADLPRYHEGAGRGMCWGGVGDGRFRNGWRWPSSEHSWGRAFARAGKTPFHKENYRLYWLLQGMLYTCNESV